MALMMITNDDVNLDNDDDDDTYGDTGDNKDGLVLDCPPAKQEGRRRREIGKRRRWSDSSMVVHLQSTFTVCLVG